MLKLSNWKNYWPKRYLKVGAVTIGAIVLVMFASVKTMVKSDKSIIQISPKPSSVVPSPTATPSVTPVIRNKQISGTTVPTQAISITSSSNQPTNTPQPTNSPSSAPEGDTTPPYIEWMYGPSDGGSYDFDGFCFPMKVADNVSGYSDINERFQFDSSSWTDWAVNVAPCYSNVSAGKHTFSIQLKDKAGNLSAVTTRNFTTHSAQPNPPSNPSPTQTVPTPTIENTTPTPTI